MQNRYELIGQIGDGSFGRVMKATSKETGEVVAIKHIKRKFKTWNACIDLREVQSLKVLIHPNIVSIREVIRESDDSLYFVFEYMSDGNLYGLMKKSTNTKSLTKSSGHEPEAERLTNQRISSITKQILSALSYMHNRGYFHRDIKPENILIRGDLVKVADFGLARDIRSHPPYTYYVSTRWYRAPEVILRSTIYGPPIDIFATGLILAELYSLCPLFPGESEIDQLNLMIGLLGSPGDSSWDEGASLLNKMNIAIPPSKMPEDFTEMSIESGLRRKMPQGSSPSAATLIRLMIQWNPLFRPSAKEAICHEYFNECGQSRAILKVDSHNIDFKSKTDVDDDSAKIGIDDEETNRANAMSATSKQNSNSHDDIDESKKKNFFSSKFKSFLCEFAKADSTKSEENENEFSSYISVVCAPKRLLESKPVPPDMSKNSNTDKTTRSLFVHNRALTKRFGNVTRAPFNKRFESNIARNSRRDRIIRTTVLGDTAPPKKQSSKKKHVNRRVHDHSSRPRWLCGNNMSRSAIEVKVCVASKREEGHDDF
ncbi:hypothetical protein ACHAXS_011342 [Conticribra weissflogii]